VGGISELKVEKNLNFSQKSFQKRRKSLAEAGKEAAEAFGGAAPHYAMVLEESKAQTKWDFHSLLQTIQTILCLALAGESQPLRVCIEWSKAYCAICVRNFALTNAKPLPRAIKLQKIERCKRISRQG
jgi:hypothetical protein